MWGSNYSAHLLLPHLLLLYVSVLNRRQALKGHEAIVEEAVVEEAVVEEAVAEQAGVEEAVVVEGV